MFCVILFFQYLDAADSTEGDYQQTQVKKKDKTESRKVATALLKDKIGGIFGQQESTPAAATVDIGIDTLTASSKKRQGTSPTTPSPSSNKKPKNALYDADDDPIVQALIQSRDADDKMRNQQHTTMCELIKALSPNSKAAADEQPSKFKCAGWTCAQVCAVALNVTKNDAIIEKLREADIDGDAIAAIDCADLLDLLAPEGGALVRIQIKKLWSKLSSPHKPSYP